MIHRPNYLSRFSSFILVKYGTTLFDNYHELASNRQRNRVRSMSMPIDPSYSGDFLISDKTLSSLARQWTANQAPTEIDR